ncbi:TetR family transcriptional regulator [Pueribacillus theae]|uniref:TetR family transcriptional regulator n=1 Tax=Pueribacillus theae TaxID=2171751 RepID=A0A2U1K426_9BACI|nr:TetR/AcrR family transcriptional regulator [Pueribacillus theae]PWA12162.1 TetR family transcriptional regulator [Pueribacillus theae]
MVSEKKINLINSAVHLFEKQGYMQTSVQDIVEHANVTKGSFYYYFDSKEDLLYLIHDEFIEYELKKVTEITELPNLSCTEKLKRMIEATWKSIALYKEKVTIYLLERRFITAEKNKLIKQKRDKFEDCFVNILKEGIKSGEFDPTINPKLIAFSILGMSGWGIHWYRQDGELSIEEIAKIHQNMILKGISI